MALLTILRRAGAALPLVLAFGPAAAQSTGDAVLALAIDPYGFDALWMQGGGITRATLLILAAMSVASWYVLVVRLAGHLRLSRQTAAADRAFRGAGSLEEGLAALPGGNPLRAVAAAAIEANRRHEGALVEAVDRHTWIGLCLQRSVGAVIARLQGGLTLLATVAATAPFVGLFGTVWGIHHALTAIGASGQASIDKVAGPVGEALIMTAIGLVVAVPAVLGHNWLARRNKLAAEAIRAFAADLHAALLCGGGLDETAPVDLRQPRPLARST